MFSNKKQNLGFLGMSGIGKSYWTAKLAKYGFTAIDCDARVIVEVSKSANIPFSTLHEAGNWLQFPNMPNYAQREALFLACENEIIAQIAKMDFANQTNRYIIDMGGSAIYAQEEVLELLKQKLFLIYFDISEEVYQEMLEKYLKNPPPVIWNGFFSQNEGENTIQAFQQSYPKLIQSRRQKYLELADLVIPYELHRQKNWQVDDFLAYTKV